MRSIVILFRWILATALLTAVKPLAVQRSSSRVLQQDPTNVDPKAVLGGGRREFAAALAFSLATTGFPQISLAVKGAAQLDAEFYAKSLATRVSGGTPKPRSVVAPPQPLRPVDAEFARTLELSYYALMSQRTGRPQADLERRFAEIASTRAVPVSFDGGLSYVYAAVAPSSVPLKAGSPLRDNQALSFHVFVWWKLAVETFDNLPQRRDFAFALGDAILAQLETSDSVLGQGGAPSNISGLEVRASQVLAALEKRGFLESFGIEVPEDQDDDWREGYSVEWEVTVRGAADLDASLQVKVTFPCFCALDHAWEASPRFV